MKKTYLVVLVVVALFSSYCFTKSGDQELQAQTLELSGMNTVQGLRFFTSGDNGRTAYVWELQGNTPVCVGEGTVGGTLLGFETSSEPETPPLNHIAR